MIAYYCFTEKGWSPSDVIKKSQKELAFIYACADKYEKEKKESYDKIK